MKFYFDEDSAQHRLVAALRSHAIDVTTFLDSGMKARDDESQLMLASAQGRILVSANTRDFAALVRRILRLTPSGFDLADGIHYLSSF